MATSNICWGIEVGAGGIKGLKLEAQGQTVKVLDFVVIPHRKVLSTPGLDPAEMIRVSLGEFGSQVDLTGTSVAISVPGHSAFARFAKLPPVEPKKVPDIVKFEAVQQIPFPIDQVEWDYQTFKAPDSPDVEVGIFAITRERIMERLAVYQDVGITPDYVTLSPVAAYNAMAFDLAFTEKTPGTIVLDIGTTSTDLIIAEAGRVWIRTFPIGGHHFTEALVNAFQLSYSKAEKLKREAESTKHARHVFQAMRPVFGDLAQDVQRSIGYYQSLHKDAKLERLIGLGSTFRLPGLRKYLKQQVGMDVFRMEQFKRISFDGPRAGEFQAQTLTLGTAYGLALQGIGMAALEANLMPVQVIRDAMWSRKVKWFGIAAGIAVAAGAAMFIRPFLDNTEINSNPRPSVVTQVVNKASQLKSDAQDVTSPTLGNPAAGEILSLTEKRDLYARIADDLGQMLAFSQERASKKDQPAFIVTQFNTEYLPGGGGGDAGMGMGGDPTATGGSDDAALAGQPRVYVTLTVTTTEPEALRFSMNTLDAWIRQNAKRDGVPYQLVRKFPPRMEGSQTTSSSFSGEMAGIPQGGTLIGGPQPSGKGGSSAPPPLFGGNTRFQSETNMAMSTPQSTANMDEVRQIAPLPPEPPPADGTTTSTFGVEWEVVILPKAPQPEGGIQ